MNITVDNLTTAIAVSNEDPSKMTMATLFAFVVRASAASGITTGEMGDRLALAKVLEAAKDAETFALTKSQADLLLDLEAKHKWGMMHDDLVALRPWLKKAIHEAETALPEDSTAAKLKAVSAQ